MSVSPFLGKTMHVNIRHVFTFWQTNIAMENGPFEDVCPIENGDIPLLC